MFLEAQKLIGLRKKSFLHRNANIIVNLKP